MLPPHPAEFVQDPRLPHDGKLALSNMIPLSGYAEAVVEAAQFSPSSSTLARVDIPIPSTDYRAIYANICAVETFLSSSFFPRTAEMRLLIVKGLEVTEKIHALWCNADTNKDTKLSSVYVSLELLHLYGEQLSIAEALDGIYSQRNSRRTAEKDHPS